MTFLLDTRLREWLSGQVLVQFDGRILPVDVRVATWAAALSVPDRRPSSDGLIAATALAHGVPVVTRDVSDFASVDGLAVLDPWRSHVPGEPDAADGGAA